MADLAMSIHEKLKGLLINKDLNDAMGALIEEALQSEWAIGFHDRGMGRGDYAVIEKDTEVVIIKCPYREIAEHITSIHNTAPETARQRDELLAAGKLVAVELEHATCRDTPNHSHCLKCKALEQLTAAIANAEDKP